MNQTLKDILLSKTSSKKISKVELIQELWSGYGEISRVFLEDTSVILKQIKLPTSHHKHPKGLSTHFSHNRKIKSYQIEINWYKSYQEHFADSYTPKYIDSGKVDNESYLILEDLNEKSFFPIQKINSTQIKQCLKWLASFHLAYLDQPPTGLWEVGTYWHLETRPDELQLIQDQELKEKAYLIDQKLSNAKYKTIVHGDAKLANFLFSDHSAAAVDFQYVGGGVGIKDVAYFLSSVFDEDELERNEKSCLDYYFSQLNNILVEKEWRELYCFAWCDFYRFLQGWSPSHTKINKYSHKMTKKVLSCL